MLKPIKRKNTPTFKVTVTDFGSELPLDGYTATITLLAKDKTRVIFKKVIENLVTNIQGVFDFKLSKTDTDQVSGDYFLTIEIENASEELFWTPIDEELLKIE